MKLITKLLFVFIFTFCLFACSDDVSKDEDSAKTSEESDNQTATKHDDESVETMDVMDVITEVQNQYESLFSQSATLYMLMEIVGGPEEGKIELDFTTDYVLATGEYYSKGFLIVESENQLMETDLQSYQKMDAYYMKSSSFGEDWVVTPGSGGDPIMINISDSLTSLSTLVDLVQIEEQNGKTYIYVSDVKFDSFDEFAGFFPQGQITIDESYEYTVQLDTLEFIVDTSSKKIEQLTFQMTLQSLSPDNVEETIAIQVEFVITDYNHVEEIVLPKEVLDSVDLNTDFPFPSAG